MSRASGLRGRPGPSLCENGGGGTPPSGSHASDGTTKVPHGKYLRGFLGPPLDPYMGLLPKYGYCKQLHEQRENVMPKVNGKKYAYTAAGKKKAAAAKRKMVQAKKKKR